MRAGIVVNVTRADRLRLEAIVADRSAPQKHVWRANVILAYKNGWPGIPAGRSTSRLPRRPGSTPSKASSPNSRDGASSVECSGRLPTFRLQSTGSSKKPTPVPNPSSGPLTPNASSLLQTRERKVKVDPLAWRCGALWPGRRRRTEASTDRAPCGERAGLRPWGCRMGGIHR